jgi:hypothetical protein
MAFEQINVHDHPVIQAHILSFSEGIAEVPDDPAFRDFMQERGYEYETVDGAVIGGSAPTRFLEVIPPLKERDVRDLGILCIGGTLADSAYTFGIIDPRHQEVLFLLRRFLPVPDSSERREYVVGRIRDHGWEREEEEEEE